MRGSKRLAYMEEEEGEAEEARMDSQPSKMMRRQAGDIENPDDDEDEDLDREQEVGKGPRPDPESALEQRPATEPEPEKTG